MHITDSQFKTLLDAQAVLRSAGNRDDRLRDSGRSAAADIELFIETAERIDKPMLEDAPMPF